MKQPALTQEAIDQETQQWHAQNLKWWTQFCKGDITLATELNNAEIAANQREREAAEPT